MQEFFPFAEDLLALAKEAEDAARESFRRIEEVSAYNEAKMLWAFRDCGVSESHFAGSTGYGYGDRGRDVLDAVFAKAVGAEDALVRAQIVSGTHALTVALFGVLRAGDRMVSVTGRPYDTMEEVIGIRGQGNGSLRDFGVTYEEVALTGAGKPDYEAITRAVPGAKVAYIQRSRGYALRESFTVETIGRIVAAIRAGNPDAIIVVDNCYGEFVEKQEPLAVGADLIVGSLIKNPGGGIAKTGGYIAGKQALVEQCAYRLTVVGQGKEVGCSLEETRSLLMGLFFAPSVVANALKTSVFALSLFSRLGFAVDPPVDSVRTDLIGAIELKTAENLIAFCQGIQKGSPVDSFVEPEPWEMPGYESQVIMAAGTFTLGSSIELSADGPLREPYAVWLQGGLTYQTGKLGVLQAAQSMRDAGLV